jgi:hypothetical protein
LFSSRSKAQFIRMAFTIYGVVMSRVGEG